MGTDIPTDLILAYRLAKAGRVPPNGDRLESRGLNHPLTGDTLRLVAAVLWNLVERRVMGRFGVWSKDLGTLIGVHPDLTGWYLKTLEHMGVIRKVRAKVRAKKAGDRRPPRYVWFGIASASVAG